MPINRIEDGVPPSKAIYKQHIVFETATISAFGFEETNIIPPVGKLWRILNMMLFVEALPLAATVGTHVFELYSNAIPLLQGKSTFNTDLIWRYSMWDSANDTQKPASNEGALMAIDSVHMTAEDYLIIRYTNGTDAAQPASRQIRLSIIETPLI